MLFFPVPVMARNNRAAVASCEVDALGNKTCRAFAPSGNVTAGGASAAPVRTFDPQGQLASLSIPGSGYGLAFGHDAANRLVSGSSNGAPLVTNAYDWKGRRVRKTTPDATYTLFASGDLC